MTIGLLLGLPFLKNIIGWLFERFWKNGVTTAMGTVAGASVYLLLEGMGCNLDLAHESVISFVAALPGLLSTDAKVTGQSLLEAVKSARK